jgi:hypothetical protein
VGGAVLSASGRLELIVRNDASTLLVFAFCFLSVAHCLFQYYTQELLFF